MADELAPLPAGWSGPITYKSAARPDEYYYTNDLTHKEVRVTERPTEPTPQGIERLRDSNEGED